MSLPNEFIGLARKAIAAVEASDLRGSAQHATLLSVYAVALWHSHGPIPKVREALVQARIMSDAVGDAELRKCSVWNMWVAAFLSGDYAERLKLAEEFAAMPTGVA